MGIAEILRDAPAGQLARLYLGWKIARYADEKEGYDHSQPPAPEEPLQNAVEEDLPGTNGERDIEQDDASDKEDNDDKEKIDKDLERDGAYEPAEPVPVPQGEKSQPAPKHDPSEVKWAGPTDRDNPQNWSTGKKVFVFAQICLLTFSSQCHSPLLKWRQKLTT